MIRLVRVTKVLRVFKLVRHFAGLQSLFFTIRQAARELGLLLMLIFVTVLTFSSLVYFAEKDDSTNQWSFMDSFWWGLLTITTVGNGEFILISRNLSLLSVSKYYFLPLLPNKRCILRRTFTQTAGGQFKRSHTRQEKKDFRSKAFWGWHTYSLFYFLPPESTSSLNFP